QQVVKDGNQESFGLPTAGARGDDNTFVVCTQLPNCFLLVSVERSVGGQRSVLAEARQLQQFRRDYPLLRQFNQRFACLVGRCQFQKRTTEESIRPVEAAPNCSGQCFILATTVDVESGCQVADISLVKRLGYFDGIHAITSLLTIRQPLGKCMHKK